MKTTFIKKATRFMASVLGAVMCLTVTSAGVFAETVDSNDTEEITFRLSIEEFADLASDYGCHVSIGDDTGIEPLKHEEGEYTFTDNKYHRIGTDSTLINEEVQIQDIKFESNAESVDVMICIHSSVTGPETKGIQNGGHSDKVSVGWGCQYRVFMKVNSSTPLSSTNSCKVTYYWTDRGWELI